jgi:hypothetical protein
MSSESKEQKKTGKVTEVGLRQKQYENGRDKHNMKKLRKSDGKELRVREALQKVRENIEFLYYRKLRESEEL